MPLLDVSDLLDDPDFADGIIVVRRSETVNGYGENIQSPAQFCASGVVTAASGDALKQLPDGTRVEGSIMVHTRFRLQLATRNTQADQIIWNGNTYTVTLLSDYTRYGAGFTAATCTLTDLVDRDSSQ